MDYPVFFARMFGIYCLIIAYMFYGRREQFLTQIRHLLENSAVLVLSAIFGLFLGICVVLLCPLFPLGWESLVFLMGAMSIAKAVMKLAFPEEFDKMVITIWTEENLTYWGYFIAALGLVFTYIGFTNLL